MPAQITNYQCPACTGPLQFSAETGKLACEYCGSSFAVAEIEALYAEKEEKAAEAHAAAEAKAGEEHWDTSELTEDWGADAEGMKTFSCPSCGAELICEATTAATACPYCGNPTIVPGQFRGALKPEFVLPFRVEKEQAVASLKKHYEGKVFLPKAFKSENQLEKIQGVYVPFWLFDGEAEGSAEYSATKIYRRRTGDEEITTTEYYSVHRSGQMAFEKVPVDASQKMPDDYMDSIEPFDYGDLQPFSTAYMPGYLADKYDVAVEDCQERADRRCSDTLEDALRDTVIGYDTVSVQDRNICVRRGKVHYAMLPVWMLTTKWNGKNYLFAVNGQTGRVAGNLPVSGGKVAAMFAAVAAGVSALAAVIAMML